MRNAVKKRKEFSGGLGTGYIWGSTAGNEKKNNRPGLPSEVPASNTGPSGRDTSRKPKGIIAYEAEDGRARRLKNLHFSQRCTGRERRDVSGFRR